VAILAREHGIPFYVAAPWSTIELATVTGEDISHRGAASFRSYRNHGGRQLTPDGAAFAIQL